MKASMVPAAPTTTISPKTSWVGRILSSLAIVFLLFDSGIKLAMLAPVTETFTQLGYPSHLARGLGVLELICVSLYALPRTSVLQALLPLRR